MSQHLFQQQTTTSVSFNYLLHLPATYGDGQKYPLILFLHSSGKRGSDIQRVRADVFPKMLDEQPDFPFIVVSPQCPADDAWAYHTFDLWALLENLVHQYAVDQSRIYLTGVSMGGTGTWLLAAHYPNYFAAIAPVSGDGHRMLIERLISTPTWAFHGELDEVVKPDLPTSMVEIITAFGGQARLTLFPDGGHHIAAQTYANPELYTWFLQHQRRTP